ncbi:MAG: tyrosine-type recombinase/integrase [Candidatus Eremiobacteraeota bacterium]|nr:tyrosine-type recombinase/integrase [Candidatus Eremiobacteraeota bacterium]
MAHHGSSASIATLFRATAKRAGLGHLRFHDLRHSAASLLIAAGVPITTVSQTLGHANSAITAVNMRRCAKRRPFSGKMSARMSAKVSGNRADNAQTRIYEG